MKADLYSSPEVQHTKTVLQCVHLIAVTISSSTICGYNSFTAVTVTKIKFKWWNKIINKFRDKEIK